MALSNKFLSTRGRHIIDANQKPISLKGTNFGGWLMMEAYFMHAPNCAEQIMKHDFKKALGETALRKLEKAFRDHFIVESDMRQIAAWGFNSVRVPFNYRLITEGQIKYLDLVVSWAKKYKVYVILDLHAAPGAQNHDWHSDSLGKAGLWTSKRNRHQTYALWEQISDRYKNEPYVAGYDLLNEAVLDNSQLLNEFYRETIKAIRRSDRNHILFIEGNRWAQQLEDLEDFNDDNWVYSIHFYEPLEYTFNFVPHLHYPLVSQQGRWDAKVMRRRLKSYYDFSVSRQRPIHVGEFGVNFRDGYYQEDVYLKDVVKCFNDFGFHWNYWTYKAVKHFMFPDGIFSYYPNPSWVHRPGPVTGWNRWKDLWVKEQKAMKASWLTGAFSLNRPIIKALTA